MSQSEFDSLLPCREPGVWAAEIMARAEAIQGPRRGVGEAVWYGWKRCLDGFKANGVA